MRQYFIDTIVGRMCEGRIGRPLDEDAEEASGAIVSEHVVLDGICAVDGPQYWSWDGTVELRPHGFVRIIGIRTEHDTSGMAVGNHPYNRELWLPR